jgi:hypothetical protein
VALLLAGLAAGLADFPMGKITVKVVDEDREPIEGAKVIIGFLVPADGFNYEEGTGAVGLSDRAGMFTASRKCGKFLSCYASMDGYYHTASERFVFDGVKNKRWQPWNPTITLELKQVVNPIPMYVKEVSGLPLPAVDANVGFDLVVGDWVEPHGAGKISDFVFCVHRRYGDSNNYTFRVTVGFSNEGDGLQPVFFRHSIGSKLQFPREAPVDGYKPFFHWWAYKANGVFAQRPLDAPEPDYNSHPELNYIFRVRSVKLPDGSVFGLYGKLLKWFGAGPFDESKPAKVSFTYYLNPTGTRNLEFKPEWNIFDWQDQGLEAAGLKKKVRDWERRKFEP